MLALAILLARSSKFTSMLFNADKRVLLGEDGASVRLLALQFSQCR